MRVSYLRERLVVARDLLTESGSIFVQIGDENVHLVRTLMDEIFRASNSVSTITFLKTSGTNSKFLDNVTDYIIWYAKNSEYMKYRQIYLKKSDNLLDSQYTLAVDEFGQVISAKNHVGDLPIRRMMPGDMSSQGASEIGSAPFEYEGRTYSLPPNTHWKPSREGLKSNYPPLFPLIFPPLANPAKL